MSEHNEGDGSHHRDEHRQEPEPHIPGERQTRCCPRGPSQNTQQLSNSSKLILFHPGFILFIYFIFYCVQGPADLLLVLSLSIYRDGALSIEAVDGSDAETSQLFSALVCYFNRLNNQFILLRELFENRLRLLMVSYFLHQSVILAD